MILDRKITDAQLSSYGVVSAPDKLTGTAQENKAVFDKLVKEAVAADVNGLIDDLTASTGADNIGANLSGAPGETIQDALSSLQDTKVDKVAGKALSTNDYDNTEKAKVAEIDNKADKTDVLTKTNATPFTPTGDYQPATKKYADELALSAGAVTSVFGRSGAVMAQAGDYTPQMVGARPDTWTPTPGEIGAATVLEQIDTSKTASFMVDTTASGKTFLLSNTEDLTVTLPLNNDVALPIGFGFYLRRWGTGGVVITGDGTTITLNGATDNLTLGDQFVSVVAVVKVGLDAWAVNGGLA